MRRREFLTLLVSGAAVACPLPVSGQQAAMPVVGVLSSQSQDSEAAVLAAWHQALNETGYVGGRNVALEYRFADGHAERLPMLATDLVRRQVTVLMANTTPPAFAAKAATATIPIVFVTGVDPVEVGLVASLRLRASRRYGGRVMTQPPSPLTMLLSRHTRRRDFTPNSARLSRGRSRRAGSSRRCQ
jgi:putative ABC transport system substrate-binding protein